MWRWGVSGCALALALTVAGAAWSATSADGAPIHPQIDQNGVDLVTGYYSGKTSTLSIGSGVGKIEHVTYASSGALFATAQADNYNGNVVYNGATAYVVSVGASTRVFSLNGGVVTSTQGDGAVLTGATGRMPSPTLTTADGTAYIFTTKAGVNQNNYTVLTSVKYTNGRVDTINYDASLNITSVTNNLGFSLNYSYPSSSTTTIAAQNSAATATWPTVTYSQSGTNWYVADALNRTTTTSQPSASGSITLPSGMSFSYTEDATGRVTSVYNGAGTWSYAYSTSGTTETTTVTDPNGNKKTYVSNTTLDVITSYTDALNRTTTYGYDSYGRLTSISYPHGNSAQYVYDARGNVTQTTQIAASASGLANIVTTAGYDATCTYVAKCNKPNWTKDAKGNETDYVYDSTYNTGLLIGVTKPAGANNVRPQTRYTYSQLTAAGYSGSPIWLLTQVSSCNTTTSCVGTADETRTTIGYNPNYNLTPSSITTAAGDGSVSSGQGVGYDIFGNLLVIQNPLGGLTRYRYDADRELTGVSAPDPDGSGSLIPAAQKYDYDSGGRLQYVEYGTVPSANDSDWASFSQSYYDYYTYDAQDRVIGKQRGPSGGAAVNYTQYSYDNANRLTCRAVRMNASTFGSDPASACTLGTPHFSGPDQVSQFNYYADDTMSHAFSGSGTPQSQMGHSWSYNNSDGLLSIDWDGKNNATCYSYDGFGRKTVAYYETPGQSASCNTNDYEQYGYDVNGNVTSDRHRDGVNYSFSYDALNHLTSGIDGDSFTYDNLGRTTGATRTNGGTVQESFAYDALGRTKSTTRTGLGTISYLYDAAGNRTRLIWPDGFWVGYNYDITSKLSSVLESGVSSGVNAIATFGYDSLGRLTSSERGSQMQLGYSYDNVSRLSQISYAFWNGGSNNFLQLQYDEANQISWRQMTNSLYDWAPNQADTHITYGLDGLNRITSAGGGSFSYDAKGDLTSDSVNTYGYNGHNWMVSANGAGLVYDALGRLSSLTSSGTTTQYLYDGSDLIAEYDGSGNLLRRYMHGLSGDDIVGWYEGGSRRYLLPDNQGSIIGLTDTSGNLIQTNTYDESGVPGGANLGRFQYTGQAFLPEIGLYNYKARMYAPSLGRFMQTDPSGYTDGLNWYTYAHGNPVNGTDPSGLADDSTVVDGVVVTKHQNGGQGGSITFGLNGSYNRDPGPIESPQSKGSTPTPPCNPSPSQRANSGRVTFTYSEASVTALGTAGDAFGTFQTTGGYSGTFHSSFNGLFVGTKGVGVAYGGGSSQSLSTFQGVNYNLVATLGPYSISDNFDPSSGAHVGQTDAGSTLGLGLGGTRSNTTIVTLSCPR